MEAGGEGGRSNVPNWSDCYALQWGSTVNEQHVFKGPTTTVCRSLRSSASVWIIKDRGPYCKCACVSYTHVMARCTMKMSGLPIIIEAAQAFQSTPLLSSVFPLFPKKTKEMRTWFRSLWSHVLMHSHLSSCCCLNMSLFFSPRYF